MAGLLWFDVFSAVREGHHGRKVNHEKLDRHEQPRLPDHDSMKEMASLIVGDLSEVAGHAWVSVDTSE